MNAVRTPTILFVVSQLALAALLVLGIFTEDGEPLNWLFVRQNFWSLLIAVEVLAVCAGLWEGATGQVGLSRLIVCAIGPATLITVLMAAAYYWGGTPSLLTGLVVLPSTMLALALFAPSWVAVLIGNLKLRRAWQVARDER
jgi:hypothetical protein